MHKTQQNTDIHLDLFSTPVDICSVHLNSLEAVL